MTNYPVGDFLIKLKNTSLARRKEVTVSYSKLIFALANTLKKEKYLNEVKKEGDKLSVKLAYISKEPVLVNLTLISKPGKRVYLGAEELMGHRGLSVFLVSTPQGIMTSRQAAKKNIGGEVICEIQ